MSPRSSFEGSSAGTTGNGGGGRVISRISTAATGMSTDLLQLFSCCANRNNPQGRSSSGGNRASGGRRRIDRTMIGHPTDFRHTAHLGSDDLTSTSVTRLEAQMRSKGGLIN